MVVGDGVVATVEGALEGMFFRADGVKLGDRIEVEARIKLNRLAREVIAAIDKFCETPEGSHRIDVVHAILDLESFENMTHVHIVYC